MWKEYFNATSVKNAVKLLAEKGESCRIVAGATDLILELERGVRQDIHTLIDITRIPGLDQISLDDDDVIHLGAMVTHNHCVASKLIRERAYPLAKAAWEVGAPQIRNRGTVAGNLITASPANDTITPLIALNAWVVLQSTRGTRRVALSDFYTGVRNTVMEADEMLVDIAFPALKTSQRGTFVKLALRRAQAISVVNVAVILDLEPASGISSPKLKSGSITLGAVAPTIIHAEEAETYLKGRALTDNVIANVGQLAMKASRPIDDIRGSADYRREMVRVCTMRAINTLIGNSEQVEIPKDAILLWGPEPVTFGPLNKTSFPYSPIETTVNGKKLVVETGHEKTLLRLLREEIQLTGTKEGCAEGECGACTVFLDGKAVMACLVPAPRAHRAEILTIEGLADADKLNSVQQAFVEEGAVQCGYCTPGFLMSGTKLLEEREKPTKNEIEQAITGNLCRCTGYYKIVQAIEKAGSLNSGGNNGNI
jgi:carbon-monoxide dehydrogenase medium subunit